MVYRWFTPSIRSQSAPPLNRMLATRSNFVPFSQRRLHQKCFSRHACREKELKLQKQKSVIFPCQLPSMSFVISFGLKHILPCSHLPTQFSIYPVPVSPIHLPFQKFLVYSQWKVSVQQDRVVDGQTTNGTNKVKEC